MSRDVIKNLREDAGGAPLVGDFHIHRAGEILNAYDDVVAKLRRMNEQAEHFEREMYLAQDRVEYLEEALRRIEDMCPATQECCTASAMAAEASAALKGEA